MSINLTESEQFFEIGEINTERGLLAKRNLFVFCSTILIIHFSNSIEFADLTLFGLQPFNDNSTSSFGWLLIVTLYLTAYWIYHYWQGWSRWKANYRSHFKNKALKLLFEFKETVKNENSVKSRVFTLEKTGNIYKIIQATEDHQGNKTLQVQGSFNPSAIWYVRRLLIIYIVGVLVLATMSGFTTSILFDYWTAEPISDIDRM